MKLDIYIAKRYLFSKKSHSAINVISLMSLFGIILATTALVCVLSVFNGFTDMTTVTFSAFDPDLKIVPAQGKVFDATTAQFQEIKRLAEIELISESLEENALIKFEERQEPILLKGVSKNFEQLAKINEVLLAGEFSLRDGDFDFGIMGVGLASFIGTRAGFLSPIEIHMPKRDVRVNPANPANAFTRREAYVSGIFAINQAEYDEQLYIVSIDLLREMLNYETEVSSLDIKLKKSGSVKETQKKIKEILGKNFLVKDRFEQHEEAFRMMNIEKWVTFFLLIIISIIAIFNIVSSLSMLIIEKEEDIKILRSMGASKKLISRIFSTEGYLIVFWGTFIGIILGLTICLLQIQFGLLKIGTAGTFIIDNYPISVLPSDILIIFFSVNFFGFLAVQYPVRQLRKT